MPLRNDAVAYALGRTGCPYVWGANGPDAFDCSGLVVWTLLSVGLLKPGQDITAADFARHYYKLRGVLADHNAAPGCLVCYDNLKTGKIDHIAILVRKVGETWIALSARGGGRTVTNIDIALQKGAMVSPHLAAYRRVACVVDPFIGVE
jgi:cell wall-associated NlpC family hydrolase